MTPGVVPLQADGGFVADLLRGLDVPYAEPIGAAVSFVVAFAVVYLVGRAVVLPLLERFMETREFDAHARRPIRRLTWFVVVFAAVAAAFAFAGYGNVLTSLATIAAAATLAVGLALQDVLKNFVAGVFIYTDRPFRIGDWIEWDDGTYAGVVEDISLRVTRVRTFDNELLTVPNSALTEDVIRNPVDGDRLRLQVPFGVGYDDDVHQATDLILEEAERHPGILDDHAPSVRLTELGDSSVVLTARVWIPDPSRSDFVKTRGEYVTAVKERFDEAGIDIPYPNRTLSGGIEIDGTTEPAEQIQESTE
jgi:small-conductance mechanosensitive channel